MDSQLLFIFVAFLQIISLSSGVSYPSSSSSSVQGAPQTELNHLAVIKINTSATEAHKFSHFISLLYKMENTANNNKVAATTTALKQCVEFMKHAVDQLDRSSSRSHLLYRHSPLNDVVGNFETWLNSAYAYTNECLAGMIEAALYPLYPPDGYVLKLVDRVETRSNYIMQLLDDAISVLEKLQSGQGRA